MLHHSLAEIWDGREFGQQLAVAPAPPFALRRPHEWRASATETPPLSAGTRRALWSPKAPTQSLTQICCGMEGCEARHLRRLGRFDSSPSQGRRRGGAAAGKRFACGWLGLGNGTEHWVYMGLMNASNWADSLSPCKIEEDQKMEEDQDTT